MKRWILAAAVAWSGPAAAGSPPAIRWRALARGVDYAALPLPGSALAPSVVPGSSRPGSSGAQTADGEALLHVVRVDPATTRLRAVARSDVGGELRTARQWREELGLVAVINAGMYEPDFSTHTGFFRVGEHRNNGTWRPDYRAVLLLGPRCPGLAQATLVDARGDAQGNGVDVEAYDTVIQNLRLIRGSGTNSWPQSARRWSEAAIAFDRTGKVLFVFCRAPFTMHDFNALLLALPLGVVRAMHAEGGPEASLSLAGGGLALDLAGSFETGFNEHDGNARQWPLPNVVGVEATQIAPGP